MQYKTTPRPRFDLNTAYRDYPHWIVDRLNTAIEVIEALHRLEIRKTIAESEELQQKVMEVKSKVDYLIRPK